MGLIEELGSLDINDIGSWTRRVKLFVTGVICVLLVVSGYYFVIQDMFTDLEKVERQEAQLKKTFLEKKALAINLDAYKQQMVELQTTSGIIL